MDTRPPPFGELLRNWRQRRRLSQLALAVDAEISQRHLSFVESGRSRPSREMVLHLARRLDIPLRDSNALLVAAGYAPVYRESRRDDPDFASIAGTIRQVLRGHEPYPALAVDRHWNVVETNRAAALLLAGASPELLQPPINVLRVSLHPDGLASRIVNLREWKRHVLHRLAKQIESSADHGLIALHDALKALPIPPGAAPARRRPPGGADEIAVPLTIDIADGRLSFITATTVFGTAVDVTLSEIVIETLLPADTETAQLLQAMVGADR